MGLIIFSSSGIIKWLQGNKGPAWLGQSELLRTETTESALQPRHFNWILSSGF